MRIEFGDLMTVFFFLTTLLLLAGEWFLYRRLKKANKEIHKIRKEIKEIPYLRRLLRSTQRQIDTVFYELTRNWENLSRESLGEILKKTGSMRPPRIIPPHLLDRYTMGGRIPVHEKYRDSAYPADTPLVYDKTTIDAHREQIARKEHCFPRYGLTNIWLFEALEKYPIRAKSVAIMGSNKPWYESVCLHYGGDCTTIEYNRILTDYPGLKIITPEEYDKHPVKFDAALSISSFEHDGLGRFGDPLNPEGDLEAMKKMKTMLKPGGLLYLAIPIGTDALLWNANRVYGRLRLPLLTAGWKTRESFGFKDSDLDSAKNSYEPVFVMENV